MDVTILIDAIIEIATFAAIAFVGFGAALSLPDLLPRAGDTKDARSPLHLETY